MPIFEVEANGQTFEVDAPDMNAAMSALRSYSGSSGPSKTGVGQGTALLEGLRSGLTANFGDEMAGVAAAGGTPSDLQNPFSGASDFLLGLGKLGYGALTGDQTAANRYATRRDEVRETQKAAEEQHPLTSILGNVGGSLLLPVGGMMGAATLPARMGRGAAVGAGIGGVSGLGAGTTPEDRASRAAVGTGLGAAVGAAGVPAVEGLVKGVGALASTPLNAVRAAMNPNAAAERAIGRAYREAAEVDPAAVNRLAPNELTPTGPQSVMDTLGQPGRDLARSAANISGAARDTLNKTLDDRFVEQSTRISQWFRSKFNHPDAHSQQQALDVAERTVNSANYKKAYQDGDSGVWSSELERLTGSPDVVSAMKAAAENGKSRAIVEGMGGFNPGVTFENGLLNFRKGPAGVPSYPNLQFWDYTRRELSDAAKQAARAGRNDEASYLGSLARKMNEELDSAVPSYKTARAGASSFFGAENALDAGQKFVTENFALPQTRMALSKMSQQEQKLFQDGFVSRYMEILDKVQDRADVVRRIYNSPEAKKKIELALGTQRATELEAVLRVENIMQQSLRAVQGNSTTALQLMTGGLAGAAGGGWLGFDPTASGVAGALALAGKRGVDAKVAQRVAEMLTSKDPDVLNRGIQMLSRNRSLMDALRSADSAAARVGGGQVQAVPFSGGGVPVPSRAEE